MEEVRKSYLTLSKRYHPDINPSGKQRFQKINEAYNRIRSNKFGVSDNSATDTYSYYGFDFNGFDDVKKTFKNILIMFKDGRAKENASVIGFMILRLILGIIALFLLFRPLFSFLFTLVFKIYEILYELFMILLYLLTVSIMNLIDLLIGLSILFYSITIKPVILLGDLLFGLIGVYIRESKYIIILSVIIIVICKLIESLRFNYKSEKISPFIFSTLMLIFLFICELYI